MKFKAKKNKQEFYLLFKCYWGWHNLYLSSGRPLFSKKRQFDKKGVMSPSLSFTVREIYFNKLNIDSK